MYSIKQLRNGIAQPALAYSELEKLSIHIKYRLKALFPHKIGVQGDYNTGNIGDRALGELFKSELENTGYSTELFPSTISKSNAKYNFLGGGGVLHDWLGIDYLRTKLEYVSNGGFIIGIGVPGVQDPQARKLVSETLPNVRLITVRDNSSKQRIQEICDVEVVVTADPAFIYNDPHVNEEYQTGVNFRPWFHLDDDTLSWYFNYDLPVSSENANQAYIQNAQRICDNLQDPVFIPFDKRDEEFAKNHLDVKTLKYTGSVKETLCRISAVNQMIATRFHSLIFAAICHTPVYALAYAPKVSRLAQRLNINYGKPHVAKEVEFRKPENVEQLRTLAAKNFHLAESYLSS